MYCFINAIIVFILFFILLYILYIFNKKMDGQVKFKPQIYAV